MKQTINSNYTKQQRRRFTRTKLAIALSSMMSLCLLIPAVGYSHPLELEDDPHEHETPTLPASNANVNLIGKMKINQTFDERVSDVAVMGNYAYLGTYSIGQKNCQKGGVYVFDISKPNSPKQINFIRSGNNYTYVGEGVQVIKMNTAHFKGDLLMMTNETCTEASFKNNASGAVGGVTLVDVTNPKKANVLVEGFGDFTPAGDAYTPPGIAHGSHSGFAWTHGDKAYVAIMDIGDTGIDIIDITDPKHPVMINEDYKVAHEFPSIVQNDSFVLKEIFAHDLTVKEINGRMVMLLSNWDSGYVALDVTDPTDIKLIGDTDYAVIDEIAKAAFYQANPQDAPPTAGNAHYGEISPDNKYFIGTDEVFGDSFILAKTNDLPPYPYEFFAQGAYPTVSPDLPPVTGQTVFVGRACTGDPSVPAGNGSQIAVIERGLCLFTDKVAKVEAAGGYSAILIMQREGADACSAPIDPAGAMGISRDVGFKLFGAPYDETACLDTTINLAPIAVGATGATITLSAKLSIPGYSRLFKFDSTLVGANLPAVKFPELSSHTILENLDKDNPIHMPVHEVTWSLKHPGVAYLSHYNGGFRVVKVNDTNPLDIKLEEVGHFVEGSNNFWGVQLWTVGDKEYVLASDLNYGLYIFEYIPNP